MEKKYHGDPENIGERCGLTDNDPDQLHQISSSLFNLSLWFGNVFDRNLSLTSVMKVDKELSLINMKSVTGTLDDWSHILAVTRIIPPLFKVINTCQLPNLDRLSHKIE